MPNNSKNDKLQAFSKLLDVMDELRAKCPWDSKQTFDSLRKLTIEEVFELSEAIVDKDFKKIKEELGDVLLHIVFYAKMGDEIGQFDIKDIIDFLVDKLISRHPHVFGDAKFTDVKQVKENWEKTKLKQTGNKSVLSGVPKSLPPMLKAYRLTEKAAGVGFDWEKKEDVWQKVKEEFDELLQEVKKGNEQKIQQELGDVFFVLINAARLYNFDPEATLEKTNRKFIDRFQYVEQRMKQENLTWDDISIEQLDKFWDEAKNKFG